MSIINFEDPSLERRVSLRSDRSFFFARVLSLTTRLRDHIERLDQGAMHAADDLAVTLRALLHPGRGNDVLGRLHRFMDSPRLSLILSRPPNMSTSGFSVGSVPADEPGALRDGARVVALEEWANTPLLRIAYGKKPVQLTWAAFLNRYANKWGGAHLDEHVPEDLALIDRFSSGGLTLSTSLLRSGAMQAWAFAQTLLSEPEEFRELLADNRNVIAAPGGVIDLPSGETHLGSLQWLDSTPDSLNFLWYVDTMHVNVINVVVGSMPYTITSAAISRGEDEAKAAPELRGPRIPPAPQFSDPTEFKHAKVGGKIFDIRQVRNRPPLIIR